MRFDKNVFRNITLIFQFGINMLVPILLCTYLGIVLDRLLHTTFIVIILFFLGAAAGFRNIVLFAVGGKKKTTYLGSDADKKINDLTDGRREKEPSDIIEAIDRVYKENMNE